jgi:hypothetical protein
MFALGMRAGLREGWHRQEGSCGIQVFSKDELAEEIKRTPKVFTDDMLYFFSKFGHMI